MSIAFYSVFSRLAGSFIWQGSNRESEIQVVEQNAPLILNSDHTVPLYRVRAEQPHRSTPQSREKHLIETAFSIYFLEYSSSQDNVVGKS